MDFIIEKKRMFFWRLGNMNAVKQKHFNAKGIFHKPPTSRGIWCFPYPFHDYFFVYHQWESKLPKKFRHCIGEKNNDSIFDTMTREESDQYHAQKEEAMKKVRKLYRPTKFWYNGKFYSHIDIHGNVSYDNWYLWDSVSYWAVEARKHIYKYERFGNSVERFEYSKDHFEIFIPNYS